MATVKKVVEMQIEAEKRATATNKIKNIYFNTQVAQNALKSFSMNDYTNGMSASLDSMRKAMLPITQIVNSPEYLKGMQSQMKAISGMLSRAILNYNYQFDFLNVYKNAFSGVADIISSFNHFNFTTIFERFNEAFDFKRLRDSEKIYLNTMYEAQWVPYFRADSAHSELYGIFEIVDKTRPSTKSRKDKIDKIILENYNKTKLNSIKKEWRATEFSHGMKKLLCQAIDCYNDKKYGLTVSAIAPMWERIITHKANEPNKHRGDEVKACFISLSDYNDIPKIINDFYNEFLMGRCYSISETSTEYPKRSAVAHGWYEKYPTRKMALNAILFTDLLLNLEVIQTQEGNTND